MIRSASRRRYTGPVALLGAAGLVLVHATLLRTDPVADVTLAAAPAAVRLWFSEAVEAAPDPVVVLDPGGQRVDRGGAVSPDDPTELRAAVVAGEPGTYTVRWRVVSDDGHVVEGTYAFNVERASSSAALPPGGLSPSNENAQLPLLVTGRGLHLVGLALALGALTLLLLEPSAPAGAIGRVARVGDAGAILSLIAAAVMLAAQSAAMQGSVGAGLTHAAIREAIHSRWANAWAARTFAAAALLVAFGLVRRSERPGRGALGAAVVAALFLLFATSANGHAATTAPVWLSLGADALHLAATAAWLGGGACLLALVRAARADDAVFESVRRIVPRFSTLALLCVQILIVTGLYQAWAHVARPALLTQTGYGKTLLVKLGLFALMGLPAGLNRFVLKPRIARLDALAGPMRADLLARFTRTLGLETVIGGSVLACAALLSALPPAHEETPPLPAHDAMMEMEMPMPMTARTPPRLFTASAGGRSVILSLDPGGLGSNQVSVGLRAADGRPDSASVALRAVPPSDSGLAPTLVRLASGTSDHNALLSLGTAGEWTLEVLVNHQRAATFRLVVQP